MLQSYLGPTNRHLHRSSTPPKMHSLALRRWLPLTLLGLEVVCATRANTQPLLVREKPTPASAFRESVGLNIHLSYQDTLYGKDLPLITSALRELEVLHVRDGILANPSTTSYSHYLDLAALGVKFDLISSSTQSFGDLQAAQFILAGDIDSFEAPNEMDQNNGDWSGILRSFLPHLYSKVKQYQRYNYKVVGPSLTKASSYKQLGDISAYCDWSNLHNYFSGRNPGSGGWGDDGYGSYAWSLRNIATTEPNRPIMSTETGYTNDLRSAGGIPEGIAARYIPRLLLEQWLHGVERTYVYELLSTGDEDFGLMRKDGSKKPALVAVASLMHLLSDVKGKLEIPNTLEGYSLSSANPDLHHLLFQKNDGSLSLALWREVSSFNVDKHSMLQVGSTAAEI